VGLWMSLANVVGVSAGIEVRRVAVYTWPIMVDVLSDGGWGEAAGFDD